MCDGGRTRHDADSLDAVREHREDLEFLADRDLPVSWAAEVLLDALDDADRQRR